jgi:N-acetyl-anhydromuramyl-L-alanine amidase AmpD
MDIVFKEVQNKSIGRFGYKPEAIVLHIAEGWLAGAHSWFNNPSSQASSHYMVGKNGVIWQFVKDEDTSWHAGGVNQPRWALLKPKINPNLYTIGIEHEGFTGEAWTSEMYEASSELIAGLCSKYQIPLDRNHIIGHNQINSVSRDRCPGDGVDFDKLISLAKEKYDDPVVIQELNQKIVAIERRLITMESENSQLRDDNIALTNRNNDLEGLLKAFKDTPSNVVELKKKNAELTDEIAALQSHQTSLSQIISKLEKEIAVYKSKSEQVDKLEDNKDNEDKESIWEILWGFITGK